MRTVKIFKIAAAVVIVVFLVVAQAIRIDKTNPPVEGEIKAPPPVKEVLRRSCYQCHSNEVLWPWYANVASASWLVAFSGYAFGQAAAFKKPTVCATHISSCGCEITKKGRYDLDADLNASQGLNPTNDCLEVDISNVILNLGAHKVTGPGFPNTDMGIVIKNGAKNTTVVGAAAFAAIFRLGCRTL